MKLKKASMSDKTTNSVEPAGGNTFIHGNMVMPFRITSGGPSLQTKAAPKKKEVIVTQSGTNLIDSGNTNVGFTHGGDCYVYVSSDDKAVQASQAVLGNITKSGTSLNPDILRVRKLPGQAPAAPAADPSATPATPAPAASSLTLNISAGQGSLLGIIREGADPVPVVQYTNEWNTLDYGNLPAAVKSKLPPLSTIRFANGTVWVVQDHRIVAKNNLHANAERQWVKANHTTKEYSSNKTKLEKVLTDSGLGTGAVDAQTLKAIAAIMTVEGSFDAVSPSSDSAASVGIFQWATTKNAAVKKDSSLNKFLVGLYDRSVAAKTDTGLDKVYKEAWKALSDLGLTVKNGVVELNGKAPTGQELEDTLHGTMGSNTSLKAYQILRSEEQINELLNITVSPNEMASYFKSEMGASCTPVSGGSLNLVSTKTNTHTITVKKPTTAASIRDTVSSMRAKTYIYNMYTNRPAFAAMSVWRAFRSGDQSAQIQAAMDTLIGAWTLYETTSSVKKKSKTFSEDQVRALNDATANAALDTLKSILWINKSTESLAEETLLESFVREGLELYARRDGKKDKYIAGRPARMASTETGDW